MIINGGSRGGADDLATHLLRTDTNEKVEVMEIMHGSHSLHDALLDFELMVNLTGGSLGLYHANIDPDAKYDMTDEQWWRSVELLEQEMQFEGLPRVVIKHKKDGREHLHVVWQRTDTDTMTLRSDSWDYKKHELAARQLEQEFGHERVQGKHVGEKKDRSKLYDRSDMTVSFAEYQKALRDGRTKEGILEFKQQITELYNKSQNGQEFEALLKNNDLILAQGDRRAFVIVDLAGLPNSLTRQVIGKKAKDISEHIADLDRDTLPTVAEAEQIQAIRYQAHQKQLAEQVQEQVEESITQEQIQQNSALAEIDERYKQERYELEEYQKDERLYKEGIWQDEIERKTKAYEKRLSKEREVDFWADWGTTVGQMKQQGKLIEWSEKSPIKLRPIDPKPQLTPKAPNFARYKFKHLPKKKRWVKPWIKSVKHRDMTEQEKLKERAWLKELRNNPASATDKNEIRKQMRAWRVERDKDLLNAYVDDLHRDRDDARQDFERQQTQERLTLEARRQDDLRLELEREEKHRQQAKAHLNDLKREKQQSKNRDRGHDPNEHER